MSRPKIFVGYVHGSEVTHGFMFSVLRTTMYPEANYEAYVYGQHSGVSIAKHRNKLVGVFLNSDCDYWLSVDTDACWDPSSVNQLLAHDLPIVSGHALGMDYGTQETFSAVLDYDEDGDITRRKSIGEGLTKVAAVGMHFTLIRRDVCEALGTQPGWPFSESIYRNEEAKHYHTLGEDSTFCVRAREKGFDTYVDYSCQIGHIKPYVIWPEGTQLDPLAPKELGIRLDFSGQRFTYGSHIPALEWALENTQGSILEVGGGEFSTPLLHSSGRDFRSVEPNEVWRRRMRIRTPGVRVVSNIPQKGSWGLVFIDNDPEPSRVKTLDELRGRFDTAVIHDIWPDGGRSGEYADWRALTKDYPSRFWFMPHEGGPPTMVISEREGLVPEEMQGGRIET